MHADELEDARAVAQLRPDSAAAALAHGRALLAAGRLPDAIAELHRALRLDYTLADARFALGCAWLEAGEPDKALEAFDHLEEDEEVAPKIAAARAMKTQSRSDAGYVRHLFDQFAEGYDARMIGQLTYRAPEILHALAGMVMPGREGLAVLDLGCGTGLTGALFRGMAATLDGIDLSPVMIEKAKARGLYDHLTVGDIETAAGAYDLWLAADTLVYLGDLTPVLDAAARSLSAGGFFLFTIERKDGDGFELGPKRRWRHSERYVRALAESQGFAVAGLLECEPRREAGVPVEGYAAALTRNE